MPTFTKIATATGNNSTSMSFTSIPQTYDDLAIFIGGVGIRTDYEDWLDVILNANETSNYWSAAYDWRQTASAPATPGLYYNNPGTRYGYINVINGTAGSADLFFHTGFIYIGDYSSTSLVKQAIGYSGGTPQGAATNNAHNGNGGGVLNSTSAVTSIELRANNSVGGAWKTGSSARLYGIKRT